MKVEVTNGPVDYIRFIAESDEDRKVLESLKLLHEYEAFSLSLTQSKGEVVVFCGVDPEIEALQGEPSD